MASVQKYAQDTDLARRVAEWQENIQPRLHDEVCSTASQYEYCYCDRVRYPAHRF